MIYLDTHVVVWLFLGDLTRLSQAAKTAISTHPIAISPIVTLELTYLHEIGRFKPHASTLVAYLAAQIDLRICDLPFTQVIEAAGKQTWTRDPFDRIIVGQAAVRTCKLVTKDETIQAHYAHAIW